MNLAYAALAFLAALLLILVGVTRAGTWAAERRTPPVGSFAEIDGARLHYVHVPGPADAELLPVVFIHGASANLRDQMLPIRPLLEGHAELLFVDRPGHGWSARGSGNETPDGQARTIAALMRHLGMARAVIVGHSFGGGIAAAFALEEPELVAGLVFLSAASHPWPDATTSWYYKLTARPFIGRPFAETLAYPGGRLRMAGAAAGVFAPNPVPETYLQEAGIGLVLRPGNFRYNAIDVESLHAHVEKVASLYPTITAPTVVISGDSDTVVYEEIHSLGLARDIPGAELVWIEGLGHKPDWIVPELVAAAIRKVGGEASIDLQAMARKAEREIAGGAANTGDRNRETGAESPQPAG